MKCSKCNFENPDGFQFCGKCGEKLGAPVKQEKSIPVAERERKRVTALFSDLSGYTAMTEKLYPEEVKEITGDIFDVSQCKYGKAKKGLHHGIERRSTTSLLASTLEQSSQRSRPGDSGTLFKNSETYVSSE